MALRLSAAVLLALAVSAATYPDRAGDQANGRGPDIVAVTITNTAARVTFSVRFAKAPPLGAGERARWVDMLLIGIDTPPIGPGPVAPAGEWSGANFFLGTHGPGQTGMLVRAGSRAGPLARPRVVTRGRTVTMAVPRRLLGNPAWFRFSIAAAREADRESAGGWDVVPQRGTTRYVLS